MSADLAVLGLGTMGGRVAARAVEQGLEVVGFDPMEQARERASSAGVKVVASAEEGASAARCVLLSVPLPGHVDGLVDGALRAAESGSVVVDLST
ncbi:MAG: NAD(P)-binding domain-containing protein, partial [Nocardioidaceae bacterium]